VADNNQDKTEQPTSKKREDARQKGQIAQSREIPSVLVLLGGLSVFFFAGNWMSTQLMDLSRDIFAHLHYPQMDVTITQKLLWSWFGKIVFLLSPLLGAIIIAGIFANVSQNGFLIVKESLVPKFSKLNPISGLKRLVSVRALIELLKSILKLTIIGVIAYLLLKNEISRIQALVGLDIAHVLSFLNRIALKIGFFTCLVLAFLAGLDLLFQRWQHERDLRMSKQEIKDEHKQMEGDPAVKARIRSLQRRQAMRRMMEEVPRATVIITNPTHLSVAIKFEKSMDAPQVVAKGAGPIAMRIREIATQNDVTIIEQKPLARALYKDVEIGQFIPFDLYQSVAEVLAYVYRIKGLSHSV
jgi:flagellar biosynthetic protein FlhB